MGPSTASTPALPALLETLGGFSSRGPGVTRLAYGEAWCDAHLWLQGKARELGLAVAVDAIGDLFFHDPALLPGTPDRPVLLIGSHLDTVVQGGAYDGATGVLAALLVAAELRDRHALPVVGFASATAEEGRLPAGQPGARAVLGRLKAEELGLVRDDQGLSWRHALEPVRARGCAAEPAAGEYPCPSLFRPALMLELHAEEGPVLESEGLDLGIVEHVVGCRRLRVKLTGEARHAGATPMKLRRDALVAAAAMMLAAEDYARADGPGAVATTFLREVRPGSCDTVPDRCSLDIEVRHAERLGLVELTALIGQRCREIAGERGIEVVLEELGGNDPVPLSPALADAAERRAQELKVSCRRMVSGAAHDASAFARAGIPALLLFVPSRQGVSHDPAEHVAEEQLVNGHRVLLDLARWLTDARG